MKLPTLILIGAATSCLACMPAFCRAEKTATATAKITDAPERSYTPGGSTTQPSTGAFASSSASGTGGGKGTARAEARVGNGSRRPGDYTSGSTDTDRIAQSSADTDPNGKPTARAHTRGRGTQAKAKADNDGVKDTAESRNGNDQPGKNAVGGGALPPLPNLDATAQIEKMIREADLPADVKDKVLEQLKQAKQ